MKAKLLNPLQENMRYLMRRAMDLMISENENQYLRLIQDWTIEVVLGYSLTVASGNDTYLKGNKSVFDKDYLRNTYDRGTNVIILELLYCSFFGAGNNVNCAYLQNEGLWAKGGHYPTSTTLTRSEFESILKRGGLDVQNIIVN